jgi:hypothetical protein
MSRDPRRGVVDRARGLDKLVASGRLTEEESAQLRDTAERDGLTSAAKPIQLRHATAALAEAVAAGKVSQPDADRYLARLRAGEDAHRVRRELRRAGIL